MAAGIGRFISFGEARRTMAMAEVARQMDFTIATEEVDEEASHLSDEFFTLFPLFQTGDNRLVENFMHGTFVKSDMMIFDFTFRTDRIWRQTVTAFQLHQGEQSPCFIMQPTDNEESQVLQFSEKEEEVAMALGPVFRQRYRLLGRVPESIAEYLRPRTINYVAARPGWSIQAGGEWIVIYRFNQRVKPRELPAFAREAYRLYRAFPVYNADVKRIA